MRRKLLRQVSFCSQQQTRLQRKAVTPLPPSPPFTTILARSKNCILLWRIHADEFAFATLFFELHKAGDERKERIIGAAPDIVARFELRTALPHQNFAAIDQLTAKTFHAQSLGIRIAPGSSSRRLREDGWLLRL